MEPTAWGQTCDYLGCLSPMSSGVALLGDVLPSQDPALWSSSLIHVSKRPTQHLGNQRLEKKMTPPLSVSLTAPEKPVTPKDSSRTQPGGPRCPRRARSSPTRPG